MLTFADFLARHFPGKMQKLSVNIGATCPNRDGTLGRGGCSYCLNSSFTPAYCSEGTDSVTTQLLKGKEFFARKYPSMRFLAYFQSYTSTYGSTTEAMLELCREALAVDGVDGVIIGTRPDCMPQDLLEMLASRLPWVMIEYGAESSHDSTLKLINRGHTWARTVDAVNRTHTAGIPVGLHLINGLPGETEEMMLATADRVNSLPVSVVKYHQLQLLRGTAMARDIARGLYDIHRFTPEAYARLCARLVRRLRPDIVIERFVSQSPSDLLLYPRWGLKNYQFTRLVIQELTSK